MIIFIRVFFNILNIPKLIGVIVLIFGIIGSIYSQNDNLEMLTKNFKFEDGIYTSFEQFQQNEPDYYWEEVKANLFSNPQTFITQVEYIIYHQDTISMDSIWGLAIGGLPYIRLEDEMVKKGMTKFAALRLRGKICYFDYEIEKDVEYEISAYNPLTGKPFRSAMVARKENVMHAKILQFETGLMQDFTANNFMAWIKDDDKELYNSIKELTPAEANEKLFKCLLIYVDRNEVYLK